MSPAKFSLLKDISLVLMRYTAPDKPVIIPEILIRLMDSLSKILDAIRTIIGVVVMIREALTDVVKDSPLKNKETLREAPNRAHKISLGMSFLSTFSLLKTPTIQKIITAARTRSRLRPKGSRYSAIIALAML